MPRPPRPGWGGRAGGGGARGWRGAGGRGGGRSGPRRVRAATADISVSGSWRGRAVSESPIQTESKPAASARSAIASSGPVSERPDITTSRVGISTPNSTPISDPEVEDIEPADDPVDGVEDAALVDQDVVELDGPGRRLARPRRHERRDLLRLERIPDVEGAHAAVEEGADDDVLRDEAARAVLVQVVGAEAAAAPGELLHGRQRARADGHQLVLPLRVDDPHELGPVLRRFAYRLVADDEQVLVEEGHHGVAEAGEGRLIVPAPEQARMRLVGDVEHERAAVDVADVGAVGPPWIHVGVVRAVAGVDGPLARRRALGVALP